MAPLALSVYAFLCNAFVKCGENTCHDCGCFVFLRVFSSRACLPFRSSFAGGYVTRKFIFGLWTVKNMMFVSVCKKRVLKNRRLILLSTVSLLPQI